MFRRVKLQFNEKMFNTNSITWEIKLVPNTKLMVKIFGLLEIFNCQ